MLTLKYAAYVACAAGVVYVASRPLRRSGKKSSQIANAETAQAVLNSDGVRSLISRGKQLSALPSTATSSGPQSKKTLAKPDQQWLDSGVLSAVLNVAQWPLDLLEKTVHHASEPLPGNSVSEAMLPPEAILSMTRLGEARKNTFPTKSIYYKDIADEANVCSTQQQQARKSKVGDSVGEKKVDRGIWKDPDFGPQDSSLSPDLVFVPRSTPESQPQTSTFVDALRQLAVNKEGSSLPWKLPRDLTIVRKQPGHKADGEGTWLYLDLNELQGSSQNAFTTSKKQGCSGVSASIVGNRYFATALVLVLQSNPLMCDSLIDLTYEAQGIYGVSFFVDGKWAMVWVDSYIPCLPPLTGAISERPRPVFPSASDPREIWTMVVEKAYAKLNRSYEFMLQVPLNSLLEHITGGDSNLTELNVLRGTSLPPAAVTVWRHIEKSLSGRSGGTRSFGGGTHITFIAAGSKQYLSKTANTDSTEDEMCGLAYGHVYAIVGAIDVAGQKLLQLRCPPGVSGWNGDWSPNSAVWDGEVGAAVKAGISALPASNESGDFWMSFTDFVHCFDTMATLRMKLSADDLQLREKLLRCVAAAGVGRSALTPGLELRYRHLMQQVMADQMAQELISAELPKRKKSTKTSKSSISNSKSVKAEKNQQRGGRKGV